MPEYYPESHPQRGRAVNEGKGALERAPFRLDCLRLFRVAAFFAARGLARGAVGRFHRAGVGAVLCYFAAGRVVAACFRVGAAFRIGDLAAVRFLLTAGFLCLRTGMGAVIVRDERRDTEREHKKCGESHYKQSAHVSSVVKSDEWDRGAEDRGSDAQLDDSDRVETRAVECRVRLRRQSLLGHQTRVCARDGNDCGSWMNALRRGDGGDRRRDRGHRAVAFAATARRAASSRETTERQRENEDQRCCSDGVEASHDPTVSGCCPHIV